MLILRSAKGSDYTGVYRLRYPYVSLTCITAGPAPGIATNDQGLRLKRRKRSSFASPPSNMFRHLCRRYLLSQGINPISHEAR